VKDVLNWEKLVELQWQTPDQSHGQLIVAPRGEQFSLIVRFTGQDMRVASWYVNLQAPFWRTPVGYDSTDHVLDVVVASDRRSWSWKDESEFEAAITRGYLSVHERESIREAGLRAVELALRGAPPFLDRWANWRPDSAWSIPELPRGWELMD
jgi:predicted RNA-binding protein associated with RNAse of E/G family